MTLNISTRRAAAAIALVAGLTACSTSSIVSVDTPNVLTTSTLNNPNGLAALRAGAIGDWVYANTGDGGNQEGIAEINGLMADEYPIGDTFLGRIQLDQRLADNRNDRINPIYRAIHRARRSTEQAAASVRKFTTTPTTETRSSELLVYAGYTYIMLAENFCSPQPISSFDPVTSAETYGPPLTQQQIYTIAIAKFDTAIAALTPIAGTTSLINFARVGRARAQLNLGDFSGASTTASAVAAGFRFTSTHSTTSTRENNGIFVFNWNSRRYSIADREAAQVSEVTGTIPPGVGLDFRGANDPRTTYQRGPTSNGLSFDNLLPLFRQGKFADFTTPIPLADYTEAQLIVAEAQLQAGSESGYLNILNTLRATPSLYPGNPFATGATGTNPTPVTAATVLPPLTAPSPGVVDSADVSLLFRERAFWLYGTGHRLGDLRRLLRAPYNRTEVQTYPGGGGRPWFLERVVAGAITRLNTSGANYGNQVSMLLPVDEQNNPKFVACDPTKP